jgi:hypothetical protein
VGPKAAVLNLNQASGLPARNIVNRELAPDVRSQFFLGSDLV